MAKTSSKTSKSAGRPRPVTTKSGGSRDGKRHYGCGGKLRK